MHNIIFTEAENTILLWTAAILLLIVFFIIGYIIVYNRRLKRAKVEDEEYKIIKGLLLEDQVELLGGRLMEFSFDDEFIAPKKVFIKYYGELTERVNLMYQSNVGFVLSTEEDQYLADADNIAKRPKFYYLFEVFIGRPGDLYVEGYINKELDEFVILRIAQPDLQLSGFAS